MRPSLQLMLREAFTAQAWSSTFPFWARSAPTQPRAAVLRL